MTYNNKQRALGRIAIIRAWFSPLTGLAPPRYAFQMDVSFQSDRLGGGPDDPVRFKVGLKRCQLVVVLPRAQSGLAIDHRTVEAGHSPTTVTISQRIEASSEAGGSASLGVGPRGATGSLSLEAAAKRTRSVEASSEQFLPVLLGTRSLSVEGHQSWNVARIDGIHILEGLLWDANRDAARFELVDRRPVEVQEQEKRTGMHATVTVEVRCKREDLEVTEIGLTDPNQAQVMARLINRNKAMKVAEAFIKKKLQEEGLRVGNINEAYSDLVVSELVVSLVENEDF